MTKSFRVAPSEGGLRAALTKQPQLTDEEKLRADGFVEVEDGVWEKPN